MSSYTFSLPIRTLVLVILVFFLTSSLLLFSLYIDLKPAKAFVFADLKAFIQRIVIHIKTEIRDFFKAVAKAFVVTFIANMAVKLLQKLESIHVIRNILYYSDALEFDQYIGDKLNKVVWKPKSSSDLTRKGGKELEKNLGVIAAQAQSLPFNNLRPGQVEALALAAKPASVRSVSFTADTTPIALGERTSLRWQVVGENIFAQVEGKRVALDDSLEVAPKQTTAYELVIYNNSNGTPMEKSTVIIQVGERKPTQPTIRRQPLPGSQKQAGLDQDQEKQLLAGGLAMLTSHVACGENITNPIRNVAIYQAAKNRAFDPRQIDPRSRNFYTYMANLGNPFASPDFQELAMRDMAATIEAEGRIAATKELLSAGFKSIRAERNNITRTSQTIADFVAASAQTALGAGTLGADAAFAAKAIGATLANIVTGVLLSKTGTVIMENPYCGVPQVFQGRGEKQDLSKIDSRLDLNKDPEGKDIQQDRATNPFERAFIKVNDQETIEINSGESVTLTWNAGNTDGQISITNIGDVEKTGTHVFESVTQDTEFKLTVKNDSNYGDIDIGAAFVTIKPPSTTGGTTTPPPTTPPTPPPIPTIVSFTSDKDTVDASKKEVVRLQWTLSNTGGENCKITINLGPGQPTATMLCEPGIFPHTPKTTTTYVLSVINKDTNQTVDSKSVPVTVTGSATGAQSLISEPFKPRY